MTLQAQDLQANSLTGTVAVANGFITIPIATNSLSFTGDKPFTITLRRNNEFGERLAVTDTLTLQDKSEVLQFFANTDAVAEGANVKFEIVTANVADGYTLYYTYLGSNANVTTGDITPYEGEVVIYNNTGNIVIQATEDNSAFFENEEFVGFQLRTGSLSGSIVATSNNVAIVDTSNTAFVTGTSTFRFTELDSPYVYEGEKVHVLVNTYNGTGNNAATYYYTLTGNASIYGANSGSVVINDDVGNIVINTEIDVLEGEEKQFAVQIRSGSTSGTIVTTTDNILVNAYSTGNYFPVVPSIVSMTPNVSQFWKSAAVSFSVTTTLAPDGETFYYNATGNTAPGELSQYTGSFTVTANTATVTLVGSGTATVDRTVGLEIRRGSNAGPKIAETDAGNAATLIANSGPISATGGNYTEDIGGTRRHIFLSGNNFTITSSTFDPTKGTITYAVIGGGGGGHKNPQSGGGGGGGGYVTGTVDLTGQSGAYTVNVGGGGAQNVQGSNSAIFAFGVDVAGGGTGGRPGQPGSSGGGGSVPGIAGGTGIPGQGNPGGSSLGSGIGNASSGGGGGYSEAGITPISPSAGGGRGGNGVAVPLAPTTLGATSTAQTYPAPGPASTPGGTRYFCGGGGSGCEQLNRASPGGVGGGGAGNPSQPGAPLAALAGQPAVAFSGGGGGGGGHAGGNAGTGGSGVVIISYPIT